MTRAFHAATVLASAWLLFLVEPLIAKAVLPWFGGSAAVWTVSLVFFQGALLAGYLYAHASVKWLSPRAQVWLHLALLAVSLISLPVLPNPAWKPLPGQDPTWRILGLLLVTVGLPFVALSATSPLIQSWSARENNTAPYRLYALSNVGSLLALAGYPFLVEPRLSTHTQAWAWSFLYAAFVVLCALTALRARQIPAAAAGAAPPPVSWRLRAGWLGLAACASALLCGVTNHLTQNLAPIPFLWLLPLGLYLGSFVLCFEARRGYHRRVWLVLAAAALGAMAWGLSTDGRNPELPVLIPVFAGGLFACCMLCHGELARLKPPPEQLTTFYVTLSLGGVVGSLFVALGAPRLFSSLVELPVAILGGAVVVAWACAPSRSPVPNRRAAWATSAVAGLAALALAGYLMVEVRSFRKGSLLQVRNFYGALQVRVRDDMRELMHGTIAHGAEYLDVNRSEQPITYYGPKSGIGLALTEAQTRPNLKVGVVGLGTGTLASYGRAGDTFRFYEINPLVLEVARSQFRYLNECPAQLEYVLGDARLSMESESPQNYDVLAVDAFSGDAIPVHLLTAEAFVQYFRHLKPGGVLAIHATNKYLDLTSEVELLATGAGKRAWVVDTDDDDDADLWSATWVLVSDRAAFFDEPRIKVAGAPPKHRAELRPWSDDYSNLFQILR